jgi:hypothetical protein
LILQSGNDDDFNPGGKHVKSKSMLTEPICCGLTVLALAVLGLAMMPAVAYAEGEGPIPPVKPPDPNGDSATVDGVVIDSSVVTAESSSGADSSSSLLRQLGMMILTML